MNDMECLSLIDRCITGDISPQEHATLQEQLKRDPQARAAFRERVDLEVALRTWASESTAVLVDNEHSSSRASKQSRGWSMWSRTLRVGLAIAASVIVIAGALLVWPQGGTERQGGEGPPSVVATTGSFLGTMGRQHACVWVSGADLSTGQRVAAGRLPLVSGEAELKLDSGTVLLLQGPCELSIDSGSEAELVGGSVVVHVTGLSDGFSLKTPDAIILDEGTEYAVSVNAEATEVHVFEGSVLWTTDVANRGSAERIPSGEARRYPRSRPTGGSRIPFGTRKFVRRIEATVEKGTGEGLVAYDGFENQAGRIQRDRSGFGWAGGWEPLGMRGRSSIGTIVEAPDDAAFGISRVGLRQLRLSEGAAVRRDLERALPLEPGRVYYVSFIATRHPVPASSDGSLQVSICDDDRQRGHRARNEFAFGVSSDGYPFLKTGGKVILSAPGIANDVPCLVAGKVVVAKDSSTETYLRVYQAKDNVDQHEPPAWSASGTSGPMVFDLSRIRITTGTAAVFDIDELRLGRTWESVVAPRKTEQ